MEIEFTASAGLTYRFAPNWFIGAEVFYQTEHETVVGQERWSLQAGPTIHYGGKSWWAALSWMPVLVYHETHGYQIREPQWRQVFNRKTLADPFKLDNDIPNISGATLSSAMLPTA